MTASGNRAVRLHHPNHSSSIDAGDVHFTFATGRLAYDCVTCNAKCCRGHGFHTTIGKELDLHLLKRRGLPLFLEPAAEHHATQYQTLNCAPGCFFLSDQGLCDIHAADGYAAKPETCRLFPFNNLMRFGKYLIVRPHPTLCPLQVEQPGTRSGTSDHAALLDAMSEQGIAAHVPECVTAAGEPERLIATEREIVALSEQFLDANDFGAFVRAQIALNAGRTNHTVAAAPDTAQFLRRTCELLGYPDFDRLGEDPRLIRTIVASTPYLRSKFLFQKFENGQALGGMPLHPAKIPYSLLALYLLAEAARQTGMRSVTFQTLSKLMNDFGPLVTVLGNLESVVVWQRGAPIEFGQLRGAALRAAFLRLSKALLPGVQRKRKAPLGDLLEEHAPTDRMERMMFLKQAARGIVGKILPIELEGAHVLRIDRRKRIRSTIERWALENLDERILQAAYERKRGIQPA